LRSYVVNGSISDRTPRSASWCSRWRRARYASVQCFFEVQKHDLEYSSCDLFVVLEPPFEHSLDGGQEVTISSGYKETITGGATSEISGGLTSTVNGKWDRTVNGHLKEVVSSGAEFSVTGAIGQSASGKIDIHAGGPGNTPPTRR
jgi:hypothetical protein